MDLGTSDEPGDNALTASPTGNALIDDRASSGPVVDAVGTTLNGHTYSGEIFGPRNDADLVQRATNVVRF